MFWCLTISNFVSDCDCESVVLELKNDMQKNFGQYEGIYKKDETWTGQHTAWKSETKLLYFYGNIEIQQYGG